MSLQNLMQPGVAAQLKSYNKSLHLRLGRQLARGFSCVYTIGTAQKRRIQ